MISAAVILTVTALVRYKEGFWWSNASEMAFHGGLSSLECGTDHCGSGIRGKKGSSAEKLRGYVG